MLVTNIEIIPNKRVITHHGLVQGSTVRAKHAGRDIMASFKNIFGGDISAYESLLDRARREAILRMQQQAEALGANTVINMKFETSRVSGQAGKKVGSIEVLAYGTALYNQ